MRILRICYEGGSMRKNRLTTRDALCLMATFHFGLAGLVGVHLLELAARFYRKSVCFPTDFPIRSMRA